MGICSACGKKIDKGKPCFTCDDCYNTYCTDDGYQYADDNGGFKCMSCGGHLTYTYCSY